MTHLFFLIAVVATHTGAGDVPPWGGFRGNDGSGQARSTTLPSSFSPEAAQWRTEVPPGYSSPAVTGDAVILTAAEGESLVTLCLDRQSGEERWRASLPFDGKRAGIGSPAAPSPVTDGEHIFVVFQPVGVLCYDLGGEEVWRQSLGAISTPHGLASSPVLYEGLIILQVDMDLKAYLVAFDKATGEERWRTERKGFLHGYSSPVIYQPDDGDDELILNGSFKICGYSPSSGELLWWVDGASYAAQTAPLVAGDRCFVNAYQLPTSEFGMPPMDRTFEELLGEHDQDGDGFVGKDEWKDDVVQEIWFIIDLDDDDLLGANEWTVMQRTDRETGALFSIRLGGRGDITDTHVDWKYEDRRGLPDIASPVLIGEGLYMVKSGGIFTRFDAGTGDRTKMARVGAPDEYYASPIAVGDKILTASANGQLTVIQAGDEWEVIRTESLDEELWSTPAIADGQVFLRTQEALYAFRSTK